MAITLKHSLIKQPLFSVITLSLAAYDWAGPTFDRVVVSPLSVTYLPTCQSLCLSRPWPGRKMGTGSHWGHCRLATRVERRPGQWDQPRPCLPSQLQRVAEITDRAGDHRSSGAAVSGVSRSPDLEPFGRNRRRLDVISTAYRPGGSLLHACFISFVL